MTQTYAQTIGIISIKGGVGKTTTVANLGAVLAQEFGQKVLIVDANFSAPNLGLHFGVVKPEITLNDVLNDKVTVDKPIINHPSGFDLLPTDILASNVSPAKLKAKLKPLRNDYDIILIDSSPQIGNEMLSCMMASDRLLVVTSADYPTLSCTLHAARIAKERRTPIVGLVLNKLRNKKYELDVDEIEQATSVPVLAMIPDHSKVQEALAYSIPATLYAKNNVVSIEYRKLAASLIGHKYEDKRFASKLRGYLQKETRAEQNRRNLLNNGDA
jgi:septum site-determining protein MinD